MNEEARVIGHADANVLAHFPSWIFRTSLVCVFVRARIQKNMRENNIYDSFEHRDVVYLVSLGLVFRLIRYENKNGIETIIG